MMEFPLQLYTSFNNKIYLLLSINFILMKIAHMLKFVQKIISSKFSNEMHKEKRFHSTNIYKSIIYDVKA